MTRFARRASLLGAILILSIGTAMAQGVPKHLQLARDFVANTKQENNEYSNRNIYTKTPTDFLASKWVVHTDCSGFVEDILRRSGSGVLEQLGTKKFKTRYSLLDMHASMMKSEAFARLDRVTDLKPGDIVSWRYIDLRGHHITTGHILFVDSEPVKIKPRKPFVNGLDQYEFWMIDVSQEAKSRDDTRFVSDAALRDENESKGTQGGTVSSPNFKGVGRGRIRLYVEPASGEVKGAAFSFDKAKFHEQGPDWLIVMGRPKVVAAN